jgi:hypothetical protein
MPRMPMAAMRRPMIMTNNFTLRPLAAERGGGSAARARASSLAESCGDCSRVMGRASVTPAQSISQFRQQRPPLLHNVPHYGDALALLLAFGSARTWREDFHLARSVPCLAHTLRITRGRRGTRDG